MVSEDDAGKLQPLQISEQTHTQRCQKTIFYGTDHICNLTISVTFFPMKGSSKRNRRRHLMEKKKKTEGTVMAEETRAKTNNLKDSERHALMAEAMQLIYRQGGPDSCAVRR